MFRRSKWVTLTLVAVLAVGFSSLLPASAASTDKKLSSNFTLVNLDNGANGLTISYYKPDGSDWRAAETDSLAALGDQLIKRQYDPTAGLSAGRGSVVVTSDGPLGAVVQVQARDGQVPTYGAYSGVSDGASSVGVPLVIRQRNTASGLANSQIIIQNASSATVNVEVDLVDGNTGAISFTKTGISIPANAAYEYDLDTEAGVPAGWFGSAVVRSTTSGGEVAVVSNFFTGDDAMQTFNGFPQAAGAASADAATKWFAPLFTSRLANGLSTPVAVQNVSGGSIPANAITLSCKKGDGSPDPATLSATNTTAVANTAAYFFNPVTDTSFPAGWYGSCIVTSGSANTNVFVQMRFVNAANSADPAFQRAAAYEGISSGNDIAVIPLYAKRLANGFSTAITIQNLDETNPATVRLDYKAGDGAAANCTVTLDNKVIPAGGSLIQNLRIEAGANSVPEIPNTCFGTLTVTSKNGQPIAGFVQLDFLANIQASFTNGDPFMAHNAFTIAAPTN